MLCRHLQISLAIEGAKIPFTVYTVFSVIFHAPSNAPKQLRGVHAVQTSAARSLETAVSIGLLHHLSHLHAGSSGFASCWPLIFHTKASHQVNFLLAYPLGLQITALLHPVYFKLTRILLAYLLQFFFCTVFPQILTFQWADSVERDVGMTDCTLPLHRAATTFLKNGGRTYGSEVLERRPRSYFHFKIPFKYAFGFPEAFRPCKLFRMCARSGQVRRRRRI